MIDLHDYLSFYLIVIINLVLVFFLFVFVQKIIYDQETLFFKKLIITAYVREKLYNFSHLPLLEFF